MITSLARGHERLHIQNVTDLPQTTLDSEIYSKYSSSAISTLAGKENKRRLQTLSIDNAWSSKNFLVCLAFRMLLLKMYVVAYETSSKPESFY